MNQKAKFICPQCHLQLQKHPTQFVWLCDKCDSAYVMRGGELHKV